MVTGSQTGAETSISDLELLEGQLQIPILIGSGITLSNFKNYISLCDAMIVGSYFKEDGLWSNPLSYDRTARFVAAFQTQIA